MVFRGKRALADALGVFFVLRGWIAGKSGRLMIEKNNQIRAANEKLTKPGRLN
jgi:hypothetical protein